MEPQQFIDPLNFEGTQNRPNSSTFGYLPLCNNLPINLSKFHTFTIIYQPDKPFLKGFPAVKPAIWKIWKNLMGQSSRSSSSPQKSVQNTSSTMSFFKGWAFSPKVEIFFRLPDGEGNVAWEGKKHRLQWPLPPGDGLFRKTKSYQPLATSQGPTIAPGRYNHHRSSRNRLGLFALRKTNLGWVEALWGGKHVPRTACQGEKSPLTAWHATGRQQIQWQPKNARKQGNLFDTSTYFKCI